VTPSPDSQPAPHGRGQTTITVYGRRAVSEALAVETIETQAVVVAQETPADFRKELGALCRDQGVELRVANFAEVGRLSGDARNDQGVVARIRLKNVSVVEAYVEGLTGAAASRPARVLALDGITNPQNIGMFVRAAAGAGIDAILWPSAGCPWVNGLIIKASAATVYRFPILCCHTLAEGLYELQAGGFQLAGLCSRADKSLFEFIPSHRAVFLLGSETLGLSSEIEALLAERLVIPMAAGVESLNVAVAGALALYAAAAQREARR
jgi:23S rRNA (guanosine2251-2'-O)-methyltransferase